MSKIPGDSEQRKKTPIYSGCIDLFPLALAAVARVMQHGAEKHNNGNIGWNRPASADHKDCIARHLADSGTIDPDSGELADAHLAVRALMNLQLAEENRTPEKHIDNENEKFVFARALKSQSCPDVRKGSHYKVIVENGTTFSYYDNNDRLFLGSWASGYWERVEK